MTRLKLVRMVAGWTQAAFAAEIGRHLVHYNGIETGLRRPSAETRKEISHACRVPESALFLPTGWARPISPNGVVLIDQPAPAGR